LRVGLKKTIFSSRWWWCYPASSEGCRCGETPRKRNSLATAQGLDQRSKMEEVVLKMAHGRCETILKKMTWILQLMTASTARRRNQRVSKYDPNHLI